MHVTLSPGSGNPGSSFVATVTNTGTKTATYALSLAGPGALVASLGATTLTLAPGASQNVPITTSAASFVVQGSLPLVALATLTSDSAIQSAAGASLTIPAVQSTSAAFSPGTQTISQPGSTTFLLLVHNTGNSTDSYSVTIERSTGPVSAALVGTDGSLTQSIPLLILSGLSTTAITLDVNALASARAE